MANEYSVQTHEPLAGVRIPEFKHFIIGRFLFIMALRMMSTLVGWWVYELTNAPFAIGLVGLSEVIPAVSLALYAGHVIDISEKRKLLLTGMLLYLFCAALLLLLSTRPVTGYFGSSRIAMGIYAVIFITGIVRAFTGPVFNVIVAGIVPKHVLQNATTWSQGTWLGASVTGHAAGGFLIAGIGYTGTLSVVCVLLLAAFVVMTQLRPKPALNVRGEKRTWESVREGLRFVFSTKVILGALSLDLFAVFFGGAKAMIPVYARDILKVGPTGLGWLNAATDIGSICIVVLLTLLPMRRRQGRTLLMAVAGYGICIVTFALSRSFILSFAALLVSGLLDGISVVVRSTIVQLKTPDALRGRVLSVNSIFINSSNELGQFESGTAAWAMGVVPSVVFGGCMTLLVVIGTAIKAPSLRKLEY